MTVDTKNVKEVFFITTFFNKEKSLPEECTYTQSLIKEKSTFLGRLRTSDVYLNDNIHLYFTSIQISQKALFLNRMLDSFVSASLIKTTPLLLTLVGVPDECKEKGGGFNQTVYQPTSSQIFFGPIPSYARF